jgi:hypothetical protein
LYCPVNEEDAWFIAHIVEASVSAVMQDTTEQVTPQPGTLFTHNMKFAKYVHLSQSATVKLKKVYKIIL